MSFSHLYNLTKSKQHDMKGYDDEEADMGAYGDDVAGSSYSSGSKSYRGSKYDEEDYDTREKYGAKKDDPFGWDNPKPSSQKFEYPSRAKSSEEFEDTGYDGWNDVKRSATVVKSQVPDPYAKASQKTSKYDPYPEDDYFAKNSKSSPDQNIRGKATTIVNKPKDYFSGEFDQPASNKKQGFDSGNQPKAFDFNDFGNTLDKKKSTNEDFDNIFDKNPKASSSKHESDPFAWGAEGQAKSKPQSKEFGGEFDFDFDSGKSKQKAESQKKNVADFLDEQPVAKPKQNDFDPFADAPVSSDPTQALADIKFEAPPPPTQFQFEKTQSADPVIETEGDNKFDEKRDPEDLWAKKELFNLSNLSKAKQSKLEIHRQDKPGKAGIGSGTLNVNTSAGSMGGFSKTIDNGQFSAPLGGNSFQDSFAPTKIHDTKEGKISALESAFGSSMDQPAQPTYQPQPPKNTAPAQSSSGNDDFGDFPSMFGSNPDGFGTFKGFANEGFGGSQSDSFAPPAASKPKQEKKDDWFEF